jgi:hypothetical protein
MGRLVLFFVTIGVLVFTAAHRGAAQADHVHVYGAGSLPCERWTTDRATAGEHFRVELSWVLGFVTAFQWSSGDSMADADVGGMEGFITKYCADHPGQSVSDAASALVAELRFRGTAP